MLKIINTCIYHLEYTQRQENLSIAMKSSRSELIHHSDAPLTRTRPKAPVVYQLEESASQHEQNQEVIVPQNNQNFLQPQIEAVISCKETQDEDGESYYLYLAKYRQKSYHRVEWMLENELAEKGFDFNSVKKNSMKSRMEKTKKLKLGEEHHFNPNYLIPERILTSTDLFAAIQPKKANQIKGTWQESMQLVCLKLLNFEKNSYPYGTLLLKEINSLEVNQSADEVTVPTILNRLYFGLYENYKLAWVDIGRAIRQYFRDHSDDNAEYQTVGLAMKQAAQFLYIQWFILSLERYAHLKQEVPNNTEISLHNGKTNQYLTQVKEKFKTEAEFCKRNVLMTSKVAQKPKNVGELERLNPQQLFFGWIEPATKAPIKYDLINKDDMIALDLNQEADPFYLVKWKQLSYAESTWERQSFFKHPEKVDEFMRINKMPNKETREGLEKNFNMHRDILKYYDTNRVHLAKGHIKKSPVIEQTEQKLYLLKGQEQRKPKVYGGKDVITFKDYRLLKDFQNEALNWFIVNWHQNRNTLLADEMGLGKTIQVLAFLYHLHVHQKVLGPFLVLAPLTTLQQWRREIEAWTNFNCLLYYDEGQDQGRQMCQKYEFYCTYTRKNGEMVKSNTPKFNILLTNYESFTRNYDKLRHFAFQHIVVDEAHKIKNPKSILAVNLRQLPCKRVTLMTGTPLQNNTKQLWALLNYIDPIRFADEAVFCEEFGKLNTEDEVAKLKKVLKPYLLRRVKEDVQKLIPKLSEVIIDVEMTKKQKYIYKGLLERNKNEIIKGLSTANLNNLTIQLRKCSNHPFLVSFELEQQHLKDAHTTQQINEAYMSCSGKLILLCKLLAKFREQGKKTLIFSQFVTMLKLLKEHLDRMEYNCELLHGGITERERHRAITRFSKQGSQTEVFLISTKAGGVGINLTAATQIIIYDSDWNPQNDIQATARAHRIGQKNEVTVYRLITSNTYQSEMFKTSSRKLGIDKAVFSGNFFKKSNGEEGQHKMSKEEVELLLRQGVLGFIENKNDDQQYFKQDIDQIIEKSGHRVQYALGESKNYTYSKSTFVGEHSSSQLDIRAQNFWEVALKDIKSPIQKLASKSKQLSKFNTLSQQETLMLEATNLVSDLVKSRVTNIAFNAQDERVIFELLNRISRERSFDRKYRKIADQLMEEMQKPSRRFKVKAEHVLNVRKCIQNPDLQEIQDQEEQNEKEQIEQEEETTDRPQKGKKVSKQKQVKSKIKETTGIMAKSGIRLDYEKTCFICLKPKCSIFCGGVCQRAFHSLCWKNYLQGDDRMVEALNLKEMGTKFSVWAEQIDHSTICPQCQGDSKICFCSICGKPGVLDEPKPTSKEAIRCTSKNCERVYHTKCLAQSPFAWLVELANKQGRDARDKFNCPVHYCFGCGQKVSKASVYNLHSCVKCCKTYHPKCLGTASEFMNLHGTYYLCHHHLSNSVRTALEQDYRLVNSDKKDITELRRAEKVLKPKKYEIELKQTEYIPKYSYSDFGLTDIQKFNYGDYNDELWCRYCGSRFADGFSDGPWGVQKLCSHHSKLWKKGKLELSGDEPVEPIMRKQTEIKYLNRVLQENSVTPDKLLDLLIQKMKHPGH